MVKTREKVALKLNDGIEHDAIAGVHFTAERAHESLRDECTVALHDALWCAGRAGREHDQAGSRVGDGRDGCGVGVFERVVERKHGALGPDLAGEVDELALGHDHRCTAADDDLREPVGRIAPVERRHEVSGRHHSEDHGDRVDAVRAERDDRVRGVGIAVDDGVRHAVGPVPELGERDPHLAVVDCELVGPLTGDLLQRR